jgi:hypothetical protein
MSVARVSVMSQCHQCDAVFESGKFRAMLVAGWDPRVTIPLSGDSYLRTVLCPRHADKSIRFLMAQAAARTGVARIGRISAFLMPGFGACNHCHTNWAFVEGHSTWFGSSGMFPLCEDCWRELTPINRIPFYRQLFDEWCRSARESGRAPRHDWETIETAVLSEQAVDLEELPRA